MAVSITIAGVVDATPGGDSRITLNDADASFVVGGGIDFRPVNAIDTKVGIFQCDSKTLLVHRQSDEATPWQLVVYVDTARTTLNLTSYKSNSGELTISSQFQTVSHTDAQGNTFNFPLSLVAAS